MVSLCIMSQKLKMLDDMEVIVINADSARVYLRLRKYVYMRYMLVQSNIDIHCNQRFVDIQGVLSNKEIVHPITGNYSILKSLKFFGRKLSSRMKWGLNENEMMTNDRNEG